MDVITTRHRNLQMLLEQLKARAITKNTDAAQALGGLGAAYLSQLKAGKKMGELTARKIEMAMYKPKGWMDQPQWANATGGVAGSTEVAPTPSMEALMRLLPPDERALLENYRAAGDAGKAVVEAAATAAAKHPRSLKSR